jgi:hypothetical protein
VPFVIARWFIAYIPVKIEDREGPHGIVTEKWFLKDTPFSTSLSMFGVTTPLAPKAEIRSQRH